MVSDIQQILTGLHPLEISLLQAFLQENAESPLQDVLQTSSGLDEARLHMALGWLAAKEILHSHDEGMIESVTLTEIGEKYRLEGTPENRILTALQNAGASGLAMQALRERPDLDPTEISSATGALKAAGIIHIVAGGVLTLAVDASERSQEIVDVQEAIAAVGKLGRVEKASLSESLGRVIDRNSRKRGPGKGIFRIQETPIRRWSLTELGTTIAAALPAKASGSGVEISQITPEMLKDGSWKKQSFRKYNISLPPPRITTGRKHAYREFLDGVKQKLLSMGFVEMRGPLVETEFWDMDALYMPQFHPARDIHDGYYLKEPSHRQTSSVASEDALLESVAEVHRGGGSTGSRGWRYTFDRQRAERLMLRSQGTAVSARTLAAGPKVPGKYFSIARCFRYEQVDATHAQDFFQVEGIVLGEDIHFRSLLGLLRLFAEEVAMAKEVKFLPAYFPFTEPSVELHVRHPKLGWMELGGAGLFRPEVTSPLGISVPVIAWGLGLDRMAMVALGIHDIRDLFTHDLDKIRTMRVGTQ